MRVQETWEVKALRGPHGTARRARRASREFDDHGHELWMLAIVALSLVIAAVGAVLA